MSIKTFMSNAGRLVMKKEQNRSEPCSVFIRRTATVMFLCISVVVGLVAVSCTTAGAGVAEKKTYRQINGSITKIEKYGHTVTGTAFSELEAAGYTYGDIVRVSFHNGYSITAPIVKKYEVDKGKPLVRTEYADGAIAFCINYGNLAKEGDLHIGDTFTLQMHTQGGYADAFEALDVTRTDNRADYHSDEVFANFREVTLGTAIAPHKLYRGSHPVKTGWVRAPFVGTLVERAEIATVINMSDSEDLLKNTYLNPSNPFANSYYKNLTDTGSVTCLSMGMDFTSQQFMDGIIKGLQYMRTHEPPYFIHCNEGKDRTGFMLILLGALMGADESAIFSDYMKSYENFFNVAVDTKKYTLILQKNAVPMLNWITGGRQDRMQAAEDYLVKYGMKKEEVAELKRKLSL